MRKRIGDFFLERGVITATQRQEILKYSQETGLRFGEAGLELGILSRDKLIEVFGIHYNVDFFHVDAQYFPEATRKVLTPEQMILHGAATLGFKTESSLFKTRRFLNVGLLDPASPSALQAIETLARNQLGAKEIDGVRPYLILAEQLLEVLTQVYGLNESAVRSRAHADIEPTFALYLEN